MKKLLLLIPFILVFTLLAIPVSAKSPFAWGKNYTIVYNTLGFWTYLEGIEGATSVTSLSVINGHGTESPIIITPWGPKGTGFIPHEPGVITWIP